MSDKIRGQRQTNPLTPQLKPTATGTTAECSHSYSTILRGECVVRSPPCWNHWAISRLMAQRFQQNNHTSLLVLPMLLGASASVTNRDSNPWYVREIVLLKPLSHQSTGGSVVSTHLALDPPPPRGEPVLWLAPWQPSRKYWWCRDIKEEQRGPRLLRGALQNKYSITRQQEPQEPRFRQGSGNLRQAPDKCNDVTLTKNKRKHAQELKTMCNKKGKTGQTRMTTMVTML